MHRQADAILLRQCTQTHYGTLSDATQELFTEQQRRRRRKAFLCVYAQLAVLHKDRPMHTAAAKAIRLVHAGNGTCQRPSGARSNEVPLLGWDLMLEFFRGFCGVPDLLLLTSRHFQHATFHEDFSSFIADNQHGCV